MRTVVPTLVWRDGLAILKVSGAKQSQTKYVCVNMDTRELVANQYELMKRLNPGSIIRAQMLDNGAVLLGGGTNHFSEMELDMTWKVLSIL